MPERRAPKIGRNELCPCGAGKKYKHCHGRPQPVRPTARRSVELDWMSRFMEQHVRPQLEVLYASYVRTWGEIHLEWASDPIHETDAYDTRKCLRWTEIAQEHLSRIAGPWNRRVLFKAVRAFPLSVLAAIAKATQASELAELVSFASSAVARFGKPGVTHVDEHGTSTVRMTPDELDRMKETLGPVVASIFAASFAAISAEIAYRLTGKGKKLRRPEATPVATARSYPLSALVLLPAFELEGHELIDASVDRYESRKESGGVSVTGFALASPREGDASWWDVVIAMDRWSPRKTTVHFTKQALTIYSHSYLAIPTSLEAELKALGAFAEEFAACFGMPFDHFVQVMGALSSLVDQETGYSLLRDPNIGDTGDLTFSSEAAELSQAKFLYDFLSQATLRNTPRAWCRSLASRLSSQIANAEGVADHFLQRFSCADASSESAMDAWLFYALDEQTLVLDCLRMSSFVDLCLREATAGDGPVGNRRASAFEEQVRTSLREKLGLEAHALPVKPNRRMKFPERDYGDVDFAFYWRGCLIHLDMKSWQVSQRYLRGDHQAIIDREKTLTEQLAKVERRGRKLVDVLASERRPKPSCVVDLLCVPSPEYLPLTNPALWYGQEPRVLTWSELAALLDDERRFSEMLACIGRAHIE